MAKIKLTFTEEHLKLIRNLRVRKIEINHEKSDLTKYTRSIRKELERYKNDTFPNVLRTLYNIDRISQKSKAYADEDNDKYYGIDTYDLYQCDFWYDQMAFILGLSEQVIKGTEEDTDGPKYPKEVIEHLRELDEFIVNNLQHIEDIIHQFCDRGGIKEGVTYIAYDNENIWYTEEEWLKLGRK